MALINLNLDQQYWDLHLHNAWYLAYYTTNNRPPGSIADNILQFKNNNPFYVTAWTRWAGDEISATNYRPNVIVRALGSTELRCSGTRSLDSLGRGLEERLGSNYTPSLLYKTRTTRPLHGIRNLPERRAEMHGVYAVEHAALTPEFVLILDDVTTTNTTIGEILRALRSQWPDALYSFFCLGRTTHNNAANDNIPTTYFNR